MRLHLTTEPPALSSIFDWCRIGGLVMFRGGFPFPSTRTRGSNPCPSRPPSTKHAGPHTHTHASPQFCLLPPIASGLTLPASRTCFRRHNPGREAHGTWDRGRPLVRLPSCSTPVIQKQVASRPERQSICRMPGTHLST